jgi:hypothetical protein
MPAAASAATISGRMSKSAKDGLVAWTLAAVSASVAWVLSVALSRMVSVADDSSLEWWRAARFPRHVGRVGSGHRHAGGRQPIVNVIRAVREAVETTGQPMYALILPDGPPGGVKIIR